MRRHPKIKRHEVFDQEGSRYLLLVTDEDYRFIRRLSEAGAVLDAKVMKNLLRGSEGMVRRGEWKSNFTIYDPDGNRVELGPSAPKPKTLVRLRNAFKSDIGRAWTAQQLAKKAKMAESTIHRAVNTLIDSGTVDLIGYGGNGGHSRLFKWIEDGPIAESQLAAKTPVKDLKFVPSGNLADPGGETSQPVPEEVTAVDLSPDGDETREAEEISTVQAALSQLETLIFCREQVEDAKAEVIRSDKFSRDCLAEKEFQLEANEVAFLDIAKQATAKHFEIPSPEQMEAARQKEMEGGDAQA